MKGKGKAYKKMLTSFAALFLLLLFLVLISYAFSYTVVEKQTRQANDNLVKTLKGTCDRDLEFYRNTLVKISLNDIFQNKTGSELLNNPKNQSTIKELILDMQATRASLLLLNNACTDVFVYFANEDRFVSAKCNGTMRLNVYFAEYISSDATKAEQWKSELLSEGKYATAYIDTGKTNSNIIMTYRISQKDNRNIFVGVCLSSADFADQIFSNEWSDYDWLIVDGEQRVIRGMPDECEAGTYTYIDIVELQHRSNAVLTERSDIVDWTYVLLVPKKSIQNSATLIRTFFAVCMLLSTIAAVVLIKRAMERNYQPLENLMQLLEEKTETDIDTVDEYQLLQRKINKLNDINLESGRRLKKGAMQMKQWQLSRLLLKPYQSVRENDEEESLIRQYESKEVLVLHMQTRYCESCSVSDTQRMFIIENVFSEGLQSICGINMVKTEQSQAAVLYDPDIHSLMERIVDEIYRLQRFVQDCFSFTVTVAAGSVQKGAEGIHRSYMDAMETGYFISVLEQDFINYEEVREVATGNYGYPIQTEERIISAIRSDLEELAVALIEKLFDDNACSKATMPRMRRYLIYNVYCTLLRAADEKGCVEQIEPLPERIVTMQQVEEVKAFFTTVVRNICGKSEDALELNSDQMLCNEVQEYVRKNYNDPELNVSTTAFFFHISPAVLSSRYKNITGKSLLTFINEIRIQNAVEFLKQGCTVAETAQKVGIIESSSFIRMFKKQLGVTPGKIKEAYNTKS